MANTAATLSMMGTMTDDPSALLAKEWLVTNGIGGYASTSLLGIATRRYHGLFVPDLPGRGRMLLIPRLDETVESGARTVLLSGAEYADGRIEHDGVVYLKDIRREWQTPVWTFDLGGSVVEKRILAPHGQNTVYVQYRCVAGSVRLHLRPYVTYRMHDAGLGEGHVCNVLDEAVKTAIARRTVAHITIPKDIQDWSANGHRSKANIAMHSGDVYSEALPLPPTATLRRAADILNAGSKVAILAGRGCLTARKEIVAVAETLAAPIVKPLLGKAVVPDDHPYTTGGIGLLGTAPSQEVLEECDVLLIAGSSFPYLEFYPKPGGAKAVQIDLDPSRIGLRYPAEVGLVGHCWDVLRALMPLLKQKSDRAFLSKAQERMRRWNDLMEIRGTRDDLPLKPQVVARALNEYLDSDAIICCDTGTVTTWAARHIHIRGDMELLAPGGAFFIQGIGTRDGEPTLGPFANRYVFPDAELLPVQEIVRAAEGSGFEVRDVESLREHSALTLNAWSRRLEEHHEEAVRVVGEVTYRVWRAYIAMAAYLFRRGRLSLYHTLCVKAEDGRAGLPLTREDWYEPLPSTLRLHKDAA